jgi:hypothetical protein
MTPAVKSGADLAAALTAETARLLVGLARELVWSCALRSLVRLPVALLLCTAATLMMTAILAIALPRGEGAAVARMVYFAMLAAHAIAGLLWGLHWTLHQGVQAFLAALERPVAGAIDALLAPLVWLGDARMGPVAIEDVRRACCPRGFAPPIEVPGIPKWRWLQVVVRLAAGRLLAAELAALDRVLTSLEERGQTHITPGTLQGVVRDELVARARCVALAHLRQFDWLAAAAVFGLLVVPAAVFCWIP